jgi:ATP-binding cassette subfamily B protein
MLLSHCLNHSVGYFNERLSGDLSNKINTVVEYVNRGVIRGASCYILFFVVYPLNTFFLFRITKSIPLLIFNIVWITSFYVVIFYISKISSELSKTEAENKSVASGIIIDCFTNISNVKIFASERKEFWTIKKQNKKILQSSLSIIKVRNIEYITIYIFMTSFIFIVNFVCFKRLLDKQILLDTFVFINSQIISMCYNANWALNNFCRFNRVTSSIKNAMNTILEPIVIKDKDDAIDMEKTQGRIIFKNISFNYKQQEATMCEEKNKMVFDNFSLEIDPGTKVGIVGYSGAGKSTLVNLLLRFFDVEEGNGSIEIDGYDLRDITQKSLRNNISYIPQEAILFHRSIKENIIYGKPNATEEEFMEASKKACCHEFIMQLKDNYNTLVGERGAKLSGGQRQRIAIARAILKNSPILILDEATSALDSITEKEVRTALENSMKNKTVIAVAHRLSTLNNMDRIVVLDKGKIVEDGTQKELLQIRDGLFSRMWNMQQNGIIE